jgi:hypothetical protein
MGHLYYQELRNLGYLDTMGNHPSSYGLIHVGDFHYLLPGWYWSGTESADLLAYAWDFDFSVGYQYVPYTGYYNRYALAVRPGQFEISAVPEPSTFLLLGAGLGGLVLLRKRK